MQADEMRASLKKASEAGYIVLHEFFRFDRGCPLNLSTRTSALSNTSTQKQLLLGSARRI